MNAEVKEMLARCEKLDLCQNVFVGGKWGAYRYSCVPCAAFCHALGRCEP